MLQQCPSLFGLAEPWRVRTGDRGQLKPPRDRDEARRSDGERLRRAGEYLATGLKPAVVRIARRRPTAVELPPRCLGGPYRRAVLGARELSAFAGVLTDYFSFGCAP